jgi:predicted nucleotidyltransferase
MQPERGGASGCATFARGEVKTMRNPSSAEREEIRTMVRRIVRRFHPEKIILFGSYARGDAGPDSDVDLLVVMPVTGSKREKQLEIRLALRGIPIPKDIVVTTPEEFQWRQEVPGTIERPAAQEGKVLYARS